MSADQRVSALAVATRRTSAPRRGTCAAVPQGRCADPPRVPATDGEGIVAGAKYGGKRGPSVPVRGTAPGYRPRQGMGKPDPVTRWLWGGLTAFVVVLVAVAAQATRQHPKPPAPELPYTGPVDGIQCQVGEMLTYHIHAHLDIFIGGKAMTVPANTGIYNTPSGQCLYWLHTHDTTGVIHIESPSQQSYTLGQFFDIWGLPLDVGDLAGHLVGTGDQFKAFVDGKAWTGNPRDIALQSHAEIALEYGPPWPKTTPAAYQWPSTLPQ